MLRLPRDPAELPAEIPAEIPAELPAELPAETSRPQPHSQVIRRAAARVLLLDPAGRVLLMRGFDPVEPGVRFWFTVGGGVEPGETLVDGALREVYEETGLVLRADQLRGPVHQEEIEFGFAEFWIVQSQQYFVAPAPDGWQPEPAALEQLEIDTVDAWSWWTRDQLAGQADGVRHDGPGAPGEVVYPTGLADLLDRVLATHIVVPPTVEHP